MRRLFATLGSALLGATAGHVLHQLRQRQSAPGEPSPLVVGAPLTGVAIALVAGLLAGARARLVACAVGFAVSAAAGSRLDRMIPGLGDLSERVAPS